MAYSTPRTWFKLATIFTAAAGWLSPAGALEALANDNPFEKFPLVITCKTKDTYHAFYFSRLDRDGVATYAASERVAGRISLDGDAIAAGSEGGGSCVGKTLAELRASGQAYDLPMQKAP